MGVVVNLMFLFLIGPAQALDRMRAGSLRRVAA
eukprot:COSAG01_NODE_68466_length_264_cov_0.618182_1_plen_32_part_10